VRAASNRDFDLAILEALLSAGANVSDLTLKDLFTDKRVLLQRQLVHEQRAPREAPRTGAVPSFIGEERTPRPEATPWAEDLADAIDDLLPGFSLYAERRDETHEAVTEFDLMVWALCCGADELALFMWRRTSSPIRAALIGQQLCSRILDSASGLDHLGRENLRTAEAEFNQAALALLSLIDKDPRNKDQKGTIEAIIYPDIRQDDDDEDEGDEEAGHEAESLTQLLRRHGTDDLGLIAPSFTNTLLRRVVMALGRQLPDAFRGAARRGWRVKPHRLLELAIHFEFSELVSHPACVGVVHSLWRGSRLKGRHHIRKLQSYRHDTLFEYVRLLFDPLLRGLPMYMRGEAEFVTTTWRIPLMKRWHHSFSHMAFWMFLAWYSYMPLCGHLPAMYWGMLFWVLSLCWQEVNQLWRSPSVALQDAFNFVDWVECAALIAALFLRWRLQHDADSQPPVPVPVQDFIAQVDWERWIEHKQPLRPGGRQHDDPLWAHPALVTCAPWSGELEALRSLLALSLVLQTFRLLEVFSSDQRLARIWFTLIRIYGNDLFLMVALMFLLMLGFGLAFGLLLPTFSVEGTDGPLYLLRDADMWLDVGAGSALWQAMYSVFGEFDLAELTSSAGAAFVTPLVFYFYLFFVTMPIVNLLIAMFSESYEQTTDKRAQERWHLRDAQACIRFLKMYSSYPAPFSVFIGLDSLQRWLVHAPCRACGGEPNGRRNLRPPVRRQDVTVQLQQLTARDRYIEQKEHAAKAETGYKLRALEESLRKGNLREAQSTTDHAADDTREALRDLRADLQQSVRLAVRLAIAPLEHRIERVLSAAGSENGTAGNGFASRAGNGWAALPDAAVAASPSPSSDRQATVALQTATAQMTARQATAAAPTTVQAHVSWTPAGAPTTAPMKTPIAEGDMTPTPTNTTALSTFESSIEEAAAPPPADLATSAQHDDHENNDDHVDGESLLVSLSPSRPTALERARASREELRV